ncbi:MAG TPA: dihydroneopterin aldolase [Anaerolineales bacterium]|nr:dihydroneopterin aldolase [Anaerolineales bacterium]
MDQVFISDLLARGVIGVNEWERQVTQDILINIVLYTDLHRAGGTDDLTHSIDYRSVAKKAISLAESAKRFTVEALASDLAQMCLEHTGVQRVRIRVEKPGAIRFARSVGVEIERSRDA